jgi:hypothetical protein
MRVTAVIKNEQPLLSTPPNQKAYPYLKEFAAMCGITKKLLFIPQAQIRYRY